MKNRQVIKPLKWSIQFPGIHKCTTPWRHYIISEICQSLNGIQCKVEMFNIPEMERQIFYFDNFDDAVLLCHSDHTLCIDDLFQ